MVFFGLFSGRLQFEGADWSFVDSLSLDHALAHELARIYLASFWPFLLGAQTGTNRPELAPRGVEERKRKRQRQRQRQRRSQRHLRV